MKTVILLRHAKSSWTDPALADHDRPLNDRGRGAAPAMGEWLARRDLVPDLVVCSSAVRARETVERMASAVPGMPRAVIEPRLYHAEPAAMLAISVYRLSIPPNWIAYVAILPTGVRWRSTSWIRSSTLKNCTPTDKAMRSS